MCTDSNMKLVSFGVLHYACLYPKCFLATEMHFFSVSDNFAFHLLLHSVTMRFTQPVRNINKLLDLKSLKLMDHYAQFNPSPLTIKQFIEFGKTATEKESFVFLQKEFPVRLSNIMKEINLLPGNLLEMPSVLILQVKSLKVISLK